MTKSKEVYGIPFKVHEEDPETLAAIDEGLRDVKEGRVVPAEKVRELILEWTSASPKNKKTKPTRRKR